MKIEFEVKGKIKAKQSVKFTRGGTKYTPSDIVEYANFVKLSFMSKYPEWDADLCKDKQLKAEINVYMTIPKGFSKKKKEQALAGQIRPTVKPDCDNIAKNINDALNGIVYPDDKQITSLLVNKYYSANEYVNVKISVI